MIKREVLKNVSLGLGIVRSLNFTTQSALLPLIDKMINRKSDRKVNDFVEHLMLAKPKVENLLKIDAANIASGLYPMTVMFQENPWYHFTRIPLLVRDAVRANHQRQNKETAIFDNEAHEFAENTPDYYKRNFHFQKAGYLSDDSAELYDHQVEILFSGTAQAMRRQLLLPLKSHFENSDGEGLKFLEIGCGTGSLSRSVALAFPKAQIICLDLSPHYLKRAQVKHKNLKRLNFVEGNAENLDFKNEIFDAVYSCYLFHEIPQAVRKNVIKEKLRVLKKDGFFAIADSLQKDDDPDLNWALERFPIDFHEPFYKNYIENKLEDQLSEMGFNQIKTSLHFLTKIVSLRK